MAAAAVMLALVHVGVSGAFSTSLLPRTSCISSSPAASLLRISSHSSRSTKGGSSSSALSLRMSREQAEDRREAIGSMMRLAAGSMLVLSQAARSEALCGSNPQSWEFWMPWSEETASVAIEGAVNSNKREVFYRVVGDESKERGKVKGKEGRRRPLLVVTDKFKDHEYLTLLEAVCTSDRRVILYDPLGTGMSEPLPAETRQALSSNPSSAEIFAVDELTMLWESLSKTLKVDQVHVLGNGFGAKVAAGFAKQDKTAKSVASLIFASKGAGASAPPGFQVLETRDPSNLCSPTAAEQDKEDFVQGIIAFMDGVDLK